jgi:hypothetical protein
MYDLKTGSDSGREWIEVYNTSATGIKLTDWKLVENGTNHKIIAASGGDTLAPGAYAVIADNPGKFTLDWPNFSGMLFDSAFNLSNTTDSVAFRAASSTDTGSISYESSWGAAGDGNSLNRLPAQAGAPGESGSFTPRLPSPGLLMSSAAVPPPPPKHVALAPKLSTKKVAASHTSVASVIPEPEADPSLPVVPEAQTAAVADITLDPGSHSTSLWWFVAIALALAAGGALVAARHASKREWNIVEDKAE